MKFVTLVPMMLLVGGISAEAHDYWIEKSEKGFHVYGGHLGGGHGQAMTFKDPIDPSVVRSARIMDPDGSWKMVKPEGEKDGKGVILPGAGIAVSVDCSGGFFTVTPDGEVNLPKHLVKQAVKSWESKEWIKYIEISRVLASRPLGDEIEVVLISDLRTAAIGGKIKILVLFRGQPVLKALVAYRGHPIGETDEKGEIRVRLREKGLQVISVGWKQPRKGPEADEMVMKTTLVFEVHP